MIEIGYNFDKKSLENIKILYYIYIKIKLIKIVNIKYF